jgi:hypothetical protein
MKNRAIVLGGFLILFTLIGNSRMSMNIKNNKGLIPDEETAIKIAEAIWLPIYGETIYTKKPFKAQLENEIWIVQGSIPIGTKGGVPYIEIQKNDCKVLKVTHSK